MKSSLSEDPVLIQPVESPVICKPYYEPTQYWEYDQGDGSEEPLTRYACKMATGSGKTVVMAMLVTWAFCNRARVPYDDRFPNAALICCPNLTIKERLQVLRTDNRGEDYYTQFDLVPPRTGTSCGPARS
jgi:superfamily II DNA or RNA helicase